MAGEKTRSARRRAGGWVGAGQLVHREPDVDGKQPWAHQAAVHRLAGGTAKFEFQRLHGMGEALYAAARGGYGDFRADPQRSAPGYWLCGGSGSRTLGI